MNLAQSVAQVYKQRDQEIFDHIVGTINPLLASNEWLLDSDNYTRNDDNVITFKFEPRALMKSFVGDNERKWPSDQVKNRIVTYYIEKGFEAYFTGLDILLLKVDGWDVG